MVLYKVFIVILWWWWCLPAGVLSVEANDGLQEVFVKQGLDLVTHAKQRVVRAFDLAATSGVTRVCSEEMGRI